MGNDLNIRIKINSDTKALEITQDGFEKIRKKTGDASEAVDHYSRAMSGAESVMWRVNSALGAIGIGLSIGKLAETADTWKLLEGRLRLVTNSTEELIETKKELLEISNEDRVKFENTADLYARIARSVEDLNKTQNENIDITNTINKSLIVSGGAAASSEAAIIQLGQAFASGVLRGEELNSVMEQAPRLSKAIADGMGVTIGQLRQMGADGKLTAEQVYDAILSQKDVIEEEFSQMPLTIGQSLTQINNQIGNSINEFDEFYGISAKVASSISDLSKAVSNQNGEMDTLVRYLKDITVMTGSAASAVAIYYSGQKLSAFYTAATTASMTSYNVATNMTTTSVARLTASQVALNAATLTWNRLLAVNPLILGGMALAGGVAYFYDMAQKADQEAKKAYEDRQKLTEAYNEYYATNEGKAAKLGASYQALEKSLTALETQRGKATGSQAEQLDQAIASTKKQMSELQRSAGDIYRPDQVQQTSNKTVQVHKQHSAKVKAIAKEQHDYIYDLDKAGAEFAQENYEKEQKAIEAKASAEKAMYASLNDLAGDWYTNESIRIAEQYNEWEKAGVDRLQLEEWLNASMLNLDEKRAKEQSDLAQKQFDEENKLWISLIDDFDKAMENQLFDAMTGKWESFGSWLEDFWSSLTTSLARAASAQLSDALIGGVKDLLLGSGDSSIQNIFSGYGIFGSSTDSVGTQLTTDQISSLGTLTNSGGLLYSAGGTILSESGTLLSAGTDISGLLNTASTIKTAYGMLTNGIEATVAPYIEQLATFGQSTLGAATLGAAGGYVVGSLGDALFGADTKAGIVGSIGGAIGAAVAGPVGFAVGSVLGSVVGGLFGSTKFKGYSFGSDTTGDLSDVDQWLKKKSWFGSSNKYKPLTDEQERTISGMFDTYNYLLDQMGSTNDILIKAGKYTDIGEAFAESFISAWSDSLDEDAIYDVWKDYAKSIDTTVMEAMSASVTSYISGTRSFTEWSLGSGTVDQLKFTADYLASDLEALENMMGVSGVTVDNFLSMYDEAIKTQFTPKTIENWNNLAEAIMKSSDAADAYTAALKEQVSVQSIVRPDLMMGKVIDGSNSMTKSIVDEIKSGNSDLQDTMTELVRILKNQYQYSVVNA